MDIVAQWVRTVWTEDATGGSAALLLPVAFELPELAPLLTHEVTQQEWHNFAPRSTVHHDRPDQNQVTLHEEEDRVRVGLQVSPIGRPYRPRRPPAIWVKSGESVRWQINYRYSGVTTDAWIYALDTLNFTCGPTTQDVFLNDPTHTVNELVDLF
ncbi:hypothetical protein [Umezawaea sp. Da 62-37]|uniref:hypothetical protein n=1 Tax=Umezawaea sp. Da 62-37 TaxID=3075927 RepID=UPI0028F74E0C|nr:hypothetical protein [Umezawaea sp. Da 62-37]WNV91311.1 hypothetical protein RM788_24485 [Umezawaea sp. Da 62-37]